MLYSALSTLESVTSNNVIHKNVNIKERNLGNYVHVIPQYTELFAEETKRMCALPLTTFDF